MKKICTNCKKFKNNKCSLCMSEEIKFCIENELYYFIDKSKKENINERQKIN